MWGFYRMLEMHHVTNLSVLMSSYTTYFILRCLLSKGLPSALWDSGIVLDAENSGQIYFLHSSVF